MFGSAAFVPIVEDVPRGGPLSTVPVSQQRIQLAKRLTQPYATC